MSANRDEARGTRANRDGARRRWGLLYRQFNLERAVDHRTYLTRWWIFDTPLGGVAVHRMLASDARETLHDHPFGFAALVLHGGYVERRLDPRTGLSALRSLRRGTVNRMHTYDAHTIVDVAVPTWTLLFAGRPVRRWGFRSEVGHGETLWTDAKSFDSGHYVA